jgi:IS1 transposase
LPAVKQQSVAMTRKGSGVREIVRVLGVSAATMIDVLKKMPAIIQVNERLLQLLDAQRCNVLRLQVEQVEVDEMWGFVGSKRQQWWLWHAVDHHAEHAIACGGGCVKMTYAPHSKHSERHGYHALLYRQVGCLSST